MKRTNLHKTFEVVYEKVTACPLREVKLNFFQFIYTLSGSGQYSINGHSIQFGEGDLFLITPNDCHEFDLDEECEFVVMRFQKSFINEYTWNSIDHIECLLYYSSHLLGSVLKNSNDKKLVKTLIDGILQCNTHENIYTEDLMRNLLNGIIVVTARNLSVVKPVDVDSNSDKKITDILAYIQNNIHKPELLKVSVMAQIFGLSETYLGSYFKRQCGETLQGYLSAYRLRLIEHRLKFSDSRINEIVDEFGFSDESHINKFFRKHRGQSLVAFRNSFQLLA